MEKSFSTDIYAPIDVIWEMMISAVDRPQHYMPLIEDFSIIAERDDGCDRRMVIRSAQFIDKISADDEHYIIRHHLHSDPDLDCMVTESLKATSSDTVRLEISALCQKSSAFSEVQKAYVNEGLRDAAIRIKFEAEEFWLGNAHAVTKNSIAHHKKG